MKQYHDLLQTILREGELYEDRTSVGRISHFCHESRYDLNKGFPLVTTKRIPFRWVAEELFWFLSGDTNEETLRDKGVDIWKEWADYKHTCKFGREEGDLGPIYGYLWRSFGGTYPERNGVDQIKRLIEEIQTRPMSTRMIVSGWDPKVCDLVDLPPCHTLYQFKVTPKGKLNCMLLQRSADAFLGVPFNIASYALLTHLIAYVTNLEPGVFVHNTVDSHIYKNHVLQVEEQLKRTPYPMPQLQIIDSDETLKGGGLEALLRFKMENLRMIDYKHHPKIFAPVAV